MVQPLSAFSSVWFVPADEDTPVVELSWEEAGSSFLIAEIAHDTALNERVLNYWVPGKSEMMRVPLFEFLESVTSASVHLISNAEPHQPEVGRVTELELRRRGVDSVNVFRLGASLPLARVVLEGNTELLLEIWEPDESLPLRLPLHATMTALLEASIRRDNVAWSLRN